MHTLAAMTWEEAGDRAARGAVAVLPVGAIEAHGPHLPLDTDITIALAMARAAAVRQERRGRPTVVLPPLAYTAAEFAAGFPGTISLRPETVTATVADIAASLGRQGYTLLALANAHLDPAHLASLNAGVAAVRAGGRIRIAFPDLTRKPWALRLTEEFRSGACHAGQFETSIILAEQPDLVRETLRTGLAPNPASLSHAIRDGKATFEEAGGPQAYFGDPASATAAEGRTSVETLGAILDEAIEAELSPAA